MLFTNLLKKIRENNLVQAIEKITIDRLTTKDQEEELEEVKKAKTPEELKRIQKFCDLYSVTIHVNDIKNKNFPYQYIERAYKEYPLLLNIKVYLKKYKKLDYRFFINTKDESFILISYQHLDNVVDILPIDTLKEETFKDSIDIIFLIKNHLRDYLDENYNVETSKEVLDYIVAVEQEHYSNSEKEKAPLNKTNGLIN